MTVDSDRSALIASFLSSTVWADARLDWLGQDASTRRYARLQRGDGKTAILMDAPRVESTVCTPGMTPDERANSGWNAQTRLAASRVDAFVLIANHLRKIGLNAPEIYAANPETGLALIEDFGEDREFARVIETGKAAEDKLYRAAAETLAKLHHAPHPNELRQDGHVWPILEFDSVALKFNADLFADWLHRHDARARMNDKDRARWEQARDQLIEHADSFPRAFTLRDYHAENLLWLANETVGLLDFQDAVLGWDAWDMAMLTQDARRAVSEQASEAAITSYLDATGKDRTSFNERLAVIGTLNALRITGVFARLQERDKKPKYGQFMPRQQALLARNLGHPAAAEMAAFVRETSPFIFEVQA